MLKSFLLALGIIALAMAGLLAWAGCPAPGVFWLAFTGAILTAGILIERVTYKRVTPDRPGPGWVATGERFVDPTSGQKVAVFNNPTTGERRYVEDRS